jgi:hypothetical protein
MANPFSDITNSIRTHLANNAGGLKVLYENMPKTQVREANGQMPDEFAMLDILFANADLVSIGSPQQRKHRYNGVVLVHIFTQLSKGDGRGYELADMVGNAFKSNVHNGVTFRAAMVDAGLAKANEGQYWRTSVTIPFMKDFVE